MKEKHSEYFQSSRGPNIKAQFFINEKGIYKIILEPGLLKGFECQIIGDKIQPIIDLIKEWFESYCKGRQPTVFLPLVLMGLPPYTTQVLSILRDIPFGISLTYKELAEITSNPKGARAVGNSCARNPLPLVIPCHRVLASGDYLGGFSGGIDVKKRLLEFERIHFNP